MLEALVNAWVEDVKKNVKGFVHELKGDCNFSRLEDELSSMSNTLVNTVLQTVLEETFSDEGFLVALKQFSASMGLRFKDYREVNVYVYTGGQIRIKSPYFVLKGKKRGRKKRGPNGRGQHVGLEVLGFIERGSCHFVSEIVKLALLCPSFTVAREVLSERKIPLNVKTLRRYCRALGHKGRTERGAVSLQAHESVTGQTLVIGIDGGRMRERTPKRGKKKQGQTRQGYHTAWREPKLLTVYLHDAEGKMVKAFAPIHDATLGDDAAVFARLGKY
jgi:hypothetical protein